jgi:ribosomal protein S14
VKYGNINSVTNTLPTVDNLRRWGYLRVGEETCSLCGDPNPTITHVLSMCKVALGDGAPDGFNRIKWRHDNVLREFVDSISPHMLSKDFRVFVDLEGHQHQYMGFSQKS